MTSLVSSGRNIRLCDKMLEAGRLNEWLETRDVEGMSWEWRWALLPMPTERLC